MNEYQGEQRIVRKDSVINVCAWLVTSLETSVEVDSSILTIKEENVEAPNTQSEKIRHGAPDGPRSKGRDNYDGRQPVPYAGHEAVAEFMAFPKSRCEFKSATALAKHFNVTRKTIHCWMNDVDVLKRAERLSLQNKLAGDLIVRREWEAIATKMVEMAKTGNIAAMKVYLDYARGKDQLSQEARLNEKTLEELVSENEEVHVLPSHVLYPLTDDGIYNDI